VWFGCDLFVWRVRVCGWFLLHISLFACEFVWCGVHVCVVCV